MGGEPVESGALVGFHLVVFERVEVRYDGWEGVVVAFEAGAGAMEEFGSDGNETLAGEALRDVADVGVDAEGFLEDEESGERAARGGAGGPGLHGGAVGDFEFDVFAADFHF